MTCCMSLPHAASCLAAGVRFSGLTADDRMSSGEMGPVSRRRVGSSADESSEVEAELARVHREMQRRFGDHVRAIDKPKQFSASHHTEINELVPFVAGADALRMQSHADSTNWLHSR